MLHIGGGLELKHDPTIFHALARELHEETSLTLKNVVQFLGHVEFIGRSGDVWRKYNFVIEVEEAEDEVKTNPTEHDEWGWFRREELDTMEITTKGQRRCIEEAFDRVGKRVEG